MLEGVTVDLQDDAAAQRSEQDQIGASHVVQHVQIPISGYIGVSPLVTTVEVDFPYPFLMKVGPRQSKALAEPHFNVGIVMKSEAHASIDVQVRDWIEDDSRFITGAKMKVRAWVPGAPRRVKFAATAHLSFFGYAGPRENDDEG